jgi:Uma2 family endonuclease
MTVLSNPPSTPVVVPPAPYRYGVCPLPVRRFTVDEYHRMIEWGFFAEDDGFELLEGYIVAKMPRNPLHDAALVVSERSLQGLLRGGWHVRPQCALTLLDSEPEPDLAVVRGRPEDYTLRHPGPGDVAVVVEVANTTLAEDRQTKASLYARAGIPVYWIVNVVDNRVEVYSGPSGPVASPGYAQRQDFAVGQSLPLFVGGIDLGPLPVRNLIPY